ncbi:hypothetical protein WR25_22250, partial [Diploscapter pachys]
MVAEVVHTVQPGVDDDLQLGRGQLGDDHRAAGAHLRRLAQLCRLRDIVAGEAVEQRGAFAGESPEHALDERFLVAAGGRHRLMLDAEQRQRGRHRLVDVARTLIGAQPFGHHAPGGDRGDQRAAHRLRAFGIDDQVEGAARPDVDDAQDRLAPFAAQHVGAGGVDLPHLMRMGDGGVGATERQAVAALVQIGIAHRGQQRGFLGFDPADEAGE